VSEPAAEFTISQWDRKKSFAENAAYQAGKLRRRVLGAGSSPDPPAPGLAALEILNSTQWRRSEVVILPAAEAAVISGVRRADGSEAETQRLADGTLALLARDVPPWSAERYRLVPGSDAGSPPSEVPSGRDQVMDNGVVRLELDLESGGIRSLQLASEGRELVPSGQVMDEYLYVAGRDPAAAVSGGPARVRLTDDGPLVWTAVVSREAPGTHGGIETRVRLFAGSERVEITHRFDKTMTWEPEAVLLRFPVALDSAETVVGGPWGAWRADADQAPGANRNYATIDRWADLHDEARGLQFISVDIPGIQLGSIGTDATVVGWRKATDPAPVLYSYVMNNYWETNYRAGQDGEHELRYTLRPHAGFDEAEAERVALQVAHALVMRRVDRATPVPAPPLEVSAERAIVTLLRAFGETEELLIRLYNPSDEPEEIRVARRGDTAVASIVRTDPWGGSPEQSSDAAAAATEGRLVIGPREVATFRVRR
jgi:hypothetical protein